MNLPINEHAENYLLSCFLMFPTEVGCLLAERGMTENHFHLPSNRLVASILMESWKSGTKIDLTLLVSILQSRNLFEQVGRYEILSRYSCAPSAANTSDYIDLVFETNQLRQIAQICREKGEEALMPGVEVKKVVASLGEAVSSLSGAAPKRKKTMKQMVKEKLDRFQNNEDEKNVLKTEIEKLDRFSPLKLGDMPLISGERKAGKSIFAMNIAVNAALRGDVVLYFSLEDRDSKVFDRIFAKVSRIPMIRHSSIGLSEHDYGMIQQASVKLSECPMELRDDVHDLMGIVAVIRRKKIQEPELKLVVVDYAQLVRFPMPKGSLREQEVATISRTLRLLAIELDVAILLLCQLNKEGDTRESKALEQDCTAMWKIGHTSDEENGKRIISIPFQRNGDSAIAFPVSFLGHSARIENFVEDSQ